MSIAKAQNPSLFDTFSAGYRSLNRCLWVVGIPVGLSAYLWFGAPLTLAPEGMNSSIGEFATLLSGSRADQEAFIQAILASDIRIVLAWLNFVPMLDPSAGATISGPVFIQGPLQILGLLLLINCIALLCSSLFLTVLSDAVRKDRFDLRSYLQRSLRVAGDILRYLLALLGVGLILGLPFLAISVLLIAMLPGAALPVLLAWYIVLFWAYVYTGLAPEAILISRVGPLRAIYNSVNIVRRNLFATLGFLTLSVLIGSGLEIIWRQVAINPLGVIVALLGSAYIGSGLSAARLEFYTDRLARWRGKA